jgi:hypothetical protein
LWVLLVLLVAVALSVSWWELATDDTLALMGGLFVLAGGMAALISVVISLWTHAGPVLAFRAQARDALERAADVVKDVLLDWDPDGEDELAQEEREPLPPLEPGQFRAALRGEVEAALDRVAEVLNEAPDVAIDELLAGGSRSRVVMDAGTLDLETVAGGRSVVDARLLTEHCLCQTYQLGPN